MQDPITLQFQAQYKQLFGTQPNSITLLPASGSSRKYYRISGQHGSVIGAYNPDKKENLAFLYLSEHFKKAGLKVPEIYCSDKVNDLYLQQDLGDTTLFSLLNQLRKGGNFPEEIKTYYKDVVRALPAFQVNGHKNLDYQQCYPRASFDQQSMMWDLNYFKYYFLKLSGISYDEQALEDDFQQFTTLLLKSPADFFLYRDFQSRNIMIYENKLYFIDYQGGRKGPPAYDLASLLYDAKANLPAEFREELIEAYITSASSLYPIDREEFTKSFYFFVYIRLMQAMGAYGFRGFYEKKELFLQSIPYALDNLGWLLAHHPLPEGFKALPIVLKELTQSAYLRSLGKQGLTVVVRSFSYKKGIPGDESVHGGGFVFDCRALPNPGRYPEFKNFSGKDQEVIDFLSKESEVDDFLFNIYNIVDQSVKNYLARNFEQLTVNFGCTGGQHRSVYSAEQLKKHLEEKFGVKVILEHREL